MTESQGSHHTIILFSQTFDYPDNLASTESPDNRSCTVLHLDRMVFIVFVSLFVCVYVCVCACVRAHARACTCVSVCLCVYVSVCLSVCQYIYFQMLNYYTLSKQSK